MQTYRKTVTNRRMAVSPSFLAALCSLLISGCQRAPSSPADPLDAGPTAFHAANEKVRWMNVTLKGDALSFSFDERAFEPDLGLLVTINDGKYRIMTGNPKHFAKRLPMFETFHRSRMIVNLTKFKDGQETPLDLKSQPVDNVEIWRVDFAFAAQEIINSILGGEKSNLVVIRSWSEPFTMGEAASKGEGDVVYFSEDPKAHCRLLPMGRFVRSAQPRGEGDTSDRAP